MMNWKSMLFSAVLAVTCMLPAAGVHAIGTPEEQSEDIFSLGEVVVSGRVDGIEAGETVHVITAADISKSSARTLDEALVLLSDVNIQVGNEGVPRVNVRGFRTRHVLLLLDGIPMNSTFDQQFDPSLIPVENIAKIKVTAGASSVLYGQGGLGGVINIITKKGRKRLNGKIGFESGDGAPYLARASFSGSKGDFDFFVSSSVYRRDCFPLAKSFTASLEEGEGYRKNSDSTRDNVFFNLGYTPNDELTIALTGNWVQGGYGKPASAINNKFDPYSPPAKFGRVDWFGGYSLQLASEYTPSAEFTLRSMIYYNRMDQDDNQYDNEDYDSFDDPYVPMSYQIRNRGITRGASFQPKFDFGRAGIFTLGFSGDWSTWIDSGRQKTGGDGGGNHGVGGSSPPYIFFPVSDHKDMYNASAAVEYSVSPFNDFNFAAGYAHHWQFRDEAQPDDYSVSASATYDLFRDTRLKAAFMRNIRFPSLSQLYLKDSDNPYLATERVYTYQAGLQQRLPLSSTLSIDAFRSDAYNFIAKNQNVNPAKNTNFSLYRFRGIETSLETRPVNNLRLKADYTFLKSEDLSGVGRDEVQYVPRDKVTVIGQYDFDFGLSPYVSVIYVANSYVYTKQKIATVDKAEMSDYAVVNVKLTQKLFGNKLIMYLGADNLFNKDYEQSYGIPRPGRFIYGGLEYRFTI
jgi:vitamin B12 transporter